MLQERKPHLEDVVLVPATGTIIQGYRDGVVVLTLVGEHDLTTADELRTALVEQTEHGRGVVVSLAEVEFIDSSNIHVLCSGDLVMRNFGRRLVLHAIRQSPIGHLLEIAGIYTHVLCADTLDEAIDIAAQRYSEE